MYVKYVCVCLGMIPIHVLGIPILTNQPLMEWPYCEVSNCSTAGATGGDAEGCCENYAVLVAVQLDIQVNLYYCYYTFLYHMYIPYYTIICTLSLYIYTYIYIEGYPARSTGLTVEIAGNSSQALLSALDRWCRYWLNFKTRQITNGLVNV